MAKSRKSNCSDRRNKYLKPNLGGRESGARKLATQLHGLALGDKTPPSPPKSPKSPIPNPASPPTPDAPMRLVRRPPSRLRGSDLRQVVGSIGSLIGIKITTSNGNVGVKSGCQCFSLWP